MHRRFFRTLLLPVVCLFLATARLPAQAPGAAASNMVTEFKGKLKSFQRGVLVIDREDGTEVMVQPPNDLSSFHFVAEAKLPFLQRGTMVRFSGMFGPNGVPLEPIQSVEVFQPIAAQKMPAHMRERYVPGVYAPRGQKQPQAKAKYQIVGNLMGISPAGLMMVSAGKVQVRAQLATGAKFELRLNNLSLAQEGDSVSVAGFYQPPDETKVKADRVTITTDRIYGEPIKNAGRPTRRRGRPEAKDAQDSKEAAEGGADDKPAREADSPKAGAVEAGDLR